MRGSVNDHSHHCTPPHNIPNPTHQTFHPSSPTPNRLHNLVIYWCGACGSLCLCLQSLSVIFSLSQISRTRRSPNRIMSCSADPYSTDADCQILDWNWNVFETQMKARVGNGIPILQPSAYVSHRCFEYVSSSSRLGRDGLLVVETSCSAHRLGHRPVSHTRVAVV